MKTTLACIALLLCTLTQHLSAQGIGVTGGGVYEEILVEDEELGDADYYPIPCENDSLNALPLTQLGTGYYMGFQGGLFPGGSNTDPNPHFNDGKNISKTIKPLNSLGLVDYLTGDVILLGVGPSVASDPYNDWKETQRDLGWPGTNPCLNVKGNFIGGKNVEDMLDPDGIYWATFETGLASKLIEPNQVQIVWMLLMTNTDSMDVNYYVDTVSEQYIQVLQNLYDKLPNLQQVFISGVHYTGYTSPYHFRYNYITEPFGYWSNLVVKNIIGLQISGDTRLTYSGPGKVAPFITWGPYFWADGITPRTSDGLSWECYKFRDDTIGGGFHLRDEYKYLESEKIDSFFNTNAIAKIWYKNAAAWSACGPARMSDAVEEADPAMMQIFPNPAATMVSVTVSPIFTGVTQCSIYNSSGEKVYTEVFNAKAVLQRNINVEPLPPGIYFVRMQDDTFALNEQFVKQ